MKHTSIKREQFSKSRKAATGFAPTALFLCARRHKKQKHSKHTKEAARFIEHGYKEIVLTGIHLTSYGKDLENASLVDAINAAAQEGLIRLRLGSLEPVIIRKLC